MKPWKVVLLTGILFLIVGTVGAVLLLRRGFSARNEPFRLETVIARTARNLAIPRSARMGKNPLEADFAEPGGRAERVPGPVCELPWE